MKRYNITMSEDLWERIGVEAPAGNRSYFIREALEAALGSGPSPVGQSGASGMSAADAPFAAPVSPRLTERTR